MIKTLRRKFIIITMLSVAAVLAVIIATVNIMNFMSVFNDADAILSILSQNDGHFPNGPDWNAGPPRQGGGGHHNLPPETPNNTRFFIVKVDNNGNIIDTNINFVSSVTEQQAQDYALQVLKGRDPKGTVSIFRYLVTQSDSGKMVVFMDFSNQFFYANSFMIASILISLAGLFIVFLLVVFLSKRVFKPIAESYDKQKRFITDSSHEIKTPLAVINANVEVLEIENGENEWTYSIKKQINTLTKLASSLTFLARMDENGGIEKEKFSLSDAVADTAEQFSAVASIEGKTLSLNITEGIEYTGNEEMLRRLVSILLDNALKYSDDTISVTLCKNKGKIQLECVNNTPEDIQGNPDDYFDRFYRADSSRSKETGGFGIGLSIAQSIAEAHGGKIAVKKENSKTIRFTVIL